MEIHIDGIRYTGDVVDFGNRTIDPRGLSDAIYDRPSPYTADCPAPGPIHEHVGRLTTSMGLKTRTALATAARSRGIATPHDDRIEQLSTALGAITERIDEAGQETDRSLSPDAPSPAEIDRLRERTAELRGQVAALEEIGADPTDARALLRQNAARLSELETERIAADQTRDRLRERRDRRERRLRLEDRLANVRRDARAGLVDRVRDEYVAAIDDVREHCARCDDPAGDPYDALAGDLHGDPFEVPAPVAALAVLRVAAVRAPVVLDSGLCRDVDRFPDADWVLDPNRGPDWLGTPVVLL